MIFSGDVIGKAQRIGPDIQASVVIDRTDADGWHWKECRCLIEIVHDS
jgi:hypothetical protein